MLFWFYFNQNLAVYGFLKSKQKWKISNLEWFKFLFNFDDYTPILAGEGAGGFIFQPRPTKKWKRRNSNENKRKTEKGNQKKETKMKNREKNTGRENKKITQCCFRMRTATSRLSTTNQGKAKVIKCVRVWREEKEQHLSKFLSFFRFCLVEHYNPSPSFFSSSINFKQL